MAFYDEMQETATELFGEFSQGTVRLVRPAVVVDDSRPWDPTPADPQYWVIDATARTVEEKFVDGTKITGRETQVKFGVVPGVEPTVTDQIELDGVLMTTVDMRRIPDVGTVVAYVFFVVH
jgi:hypothetical protein